MTDKLCSPDCRAEILNAAFDLADDVGYQWITRKAVSVASGASAGAVTYAFGTFLELKREVVREAIRRKNLGIIAQALVDGNQDAKKAPEELKRTALLSHI